LSGDLRVFYYQVTLGPAHLARVRALDEVPGVSCRGVQLASAERTRRYRLEPSDAVGVDTILEGTYEDLGFAPLLRAACAHLAREAPDAIIIDAPADPVQWWLGRYARHLGILATTRWAATVTDHPRFGWKEFLKGFVYRGWDGYLVTGRRGLEYLRSFGVPEQAVAICGNPVDAEPIEAARIASSGGRAETFLFVGRFLSLKNLDAFLQAFLSYRERGGTWKLKLAGFGERDRQLRETAQGVDAIEFLGNLQYPELIEAYTREGCLVLPSYSENWGLVVNEAMHAGMPVLVSRLCGSFVELVEEGGNGFGMDPFDEESMVEALQKMEALGPAERGAFSRRSVERVADHGLEPWARRVADFLRERLSASGSGLS
jgi:glycosyltransferase involved in cell wall biosynthesis